MLAFLTQTPIFIVILFNIELFVIAFPSHLCNLHSDGCQYSPCLHNCAQTSETTLDKGQQWDTHTHTLLVDVILSMLFPENLTSCCNFYYKMNGTGAASVAMLLLLACIFWNRHSISLTPIIMFIWITIEGNAAVVNGFIYVTVFGNNSRFWPRRKTSSILITELGKYPAFTTYYAVL